MRVFIYNYDMLTFILLLIGVAIAGIPIGITAIVNSCRVKGKTRAILLALAIIGLLMTIVCFVGGILEDQHIIFIIFYFGGIALSIVTLSIAVHIRRKANNKIFDDKKKEHEESVLRTNNQIKYCEEIQELKTLLDDGAITQEEYDTKKTEILNRKEE